MASSIIPNIDNFYSDKASNIIEPSQFIVHPLVLVLDCAQVGCSGKRKPMGPGRCESCMVAAYGPANPTSTSGWKHDQLAMWLAKNPLDESSSLLVDGTDDHWGTLSIEKQNRIVFLIMGEGWACYLGKLTGTDPNILYPITTAEDQKIAGELGFSNCDDDVENEKGDDNHYSYNLYRQSELDSLTSFLKNNKTTAHLSLSPEYYAIADKMRLARVAKLVSQEC